MTITPRPGSNPWNQFTDEPAGLPRLLVSEDQSSVLEAVRFFVKVEGYEAVFVNSPAAAITAMQEQEFDVALVDLNYTRDTTSGEEGLELIAQLHALDDSLPIIVMTAWGSVGLAVRAMQVGAVDFVEKPWVNSRLAEMLHAQVERGRELRRRSLRRAEELREAGETQRRMMPSDLPQFPGFQIAGKWQPAQIVGGDYFDVLDFGAHAGLCIADVSGKGVAAALLMSNLQAAVKANAAGTTDPKYLCDRVNRFICESAKPGKFITFFYARLDCDSRILTYTNAGHNAPVLVHADGSWQSLDKGGMVLGAVPEYAFEQGEIALQSGDRLVIFTDGISEACKPGAEEFGEERILSMVQELRAASADELQSRIMAAVTAHCDDNFNDEATLIVLAVD